MADPNQEAAAQSATEGVAVSEFDSLLKKEFKPKTDEAKEAEIGRASCRERV